VGIVLLAIWLGMRCIYYATFSPIVFLESLVAPSFVLLLIGLIALVVWKPKAKTERPEANQKVEETKERPSQSLLDLVAKQLKPRYCEKCGSQLEICTVDPRGFDKDTGYLKCDVVLACQHATVYQTENTLTGRKITWKGWFGGHTVDKVSVITHPEDRKKHA